MNQKKFFRMFAAIFLVLLGSVAAGNYYFDYYGVLRREDIFYGNQLSDRFVKMRYLLEDRGIDKYDSYLWGSSRVQKMDVKLTGQKTYNMGASVGMPEDCWRELKILLKNGAKIKTVYLGVDNFSYYADYAAEIKHDGIYRRPYQETRKDRLEYYADLLFQQETVKRGARENNQPKGHELITDTGVFFVPQFVEEKIEYAPELYVKEDKFLKPIQQDNWKDKRFAQCLVVIKKIETLCRTNGIKLIVFFNPIHMTTYLADDMELMNRFKKELVKISPFWDFSGVNYVTANNYFWYETSHPRAFICDKILDTVSRQHKITWVPDFGIYVTPENVDAFCEKAVRDREAYDSDHEQWVPTAEERAVMTKRVNYPW